MKEIRRNTNIERMLTTFGLGMAGAAFLILGIYTGVLSAGLIPMILGGGLFSVLLMYLSNTQKEF